MNEAELEEIEKTLAAHYFDKCEADKRALIAEVRRLREKRIEERAKKNALVYCATQWLQDMCDDVAKPCPKHFQRGEAEARAEIDKEDAE